MRCIALFFFAVLFLSSVFPPVSPAAASEDDLQKLLASSGACGGLVVHVGCGDGQATIPLRKENTIVQGLTPDRTAVENARSLARALGCLGPVTFEHLSGARLPYIDDMVNLIIVETPGLVPREEIMRVLRPDGTAYIREGERWTRFVNPYPEEIDEWTHYLHDPSNNVVANDSVIAPPKRLQWKTGPRYGRHHDRLSSVNAAVTTSGRIFYISDEALRASILLPPQWTLIARDAFNGTLLWKRGLGPWHTHLWPLKSGPAQLPRRLVASGGRVYVTLSLNGPAEALDAATGRTLHTYKGSEGTEEILFSGGILFLLVNTGAETPAFAGKQKINRAYNAPFWDEKPRLLMAFDPEKGTLLWRKKEVVLPVTLAADNDHLLYHNGDRVVCLDPKTGKPAWQSPPLPRSKVIRSFFAPILLVYKDVVLFAGGEQAGQQTGSWYRKGKDTMTALSIDSGNMLWQAQHPPSGYRSPEDLIVINDLVWTGETTSGRAEGLFTSRDVHTGEITSEFTPNVDTYWFHHRCYRSKATENYLLTARTGTEFIDIDTKKWTINHWFRGACLYGILPANGLIYTPQHPCACYLETKLSGFNALAPALKGSRVPENTPAEKRLCKGTVYSEPAPILKEKAAETWPTYRCDAARSGRAETVVPSALGVAWKTALGGKLTSPVVAENKLFVASVDRHTLYALEKDSGKMAWNYSAGGRIDSPPTIYKGRVLFGSADGYVYCLRATDGALVWRFLAAPTDQRLVSWDQVESVWPVHGSVLVEKGCAYFVSGRSMFLDSGLRLWRLDPVTGEVLSVTVLDEHEKGTDKNLHEYVNWLNMPPGMPDILSSTGGLVFMRSQPFHPDGTPLPLEEIPSGPNPDSGALPPVQKPGRLHLFSPTGFLDDSGWHRTYWMYGSTFVSGWCGYYLAGKTAPAGKILVFDEDTVYGWGRKPEFYRWSTPMEYHLFAAEKPSKKEAQGDLRAKETRIRIAATKTLNPAGRPVTVEAWVKPEKAGGVVLARGGGVYGYALSIENGVPQFSIRDKEKLSFVKAGKRIGSGWVHLAGMLSADKTIKIFIDGTLCATVKVPSLIAANPAEALEIGADEGSTVGPYTGESPFKGLIDEVRIYHGPLSSVDVQRHASSRERAPTAGKELVLAYSFEKGMAQDLSGNKNTGEVAGAEKASGKFGEGLRFSGVSAATRDFKVAHLWTRDVPVFVRALVLSGDTLFAAGPRDLLDEREAYQNIDHPAMQKKLTEQADALAGKSGGLLALYQKNTGKELLQCTLDSPPVFDGMAAASGKLFISAVNGTVYCLSEPVE